MFNSHQSTEFSSQGYLLGRTFNKSNYHFGLGIFFNITVCISCIASVINYTPPDSDTQEEFFAEISTRLAEFLRELVILRTIQTVLSFVDVINFKLRNIQISHYNYWFIIQKLLIYCAFYIALHFEWSQVCVGAAIADLIAYLSFFGCTLHKYHILSNSPNFLPLLIWPLMNGTIQTMICLRISGIAVSWQIILIPGYIINLLAFLVGFRFLISLREYFYDMFGKLKTKRIIQILFF